MTHSHLSSPHPFLLTKSLCQRVSLRWQKESTQRQSAHTHRHTHTHTKDESAFPGNEDKQISFFFCLSSTEIITTRQLFQSKQTDEFNRETKPNQKKSTDLCNWCKLSLRCKATSLGTRLDCINWHLQRNGAKHPYEATWSALKNHCIELSCSVCVCVCVCVCGAWFHSLWPTLHLAARAKLIICLWVFVLIYRAEIIKEEVGVTSGLKTGTHSSYWVQSLVSLV